MKKQPQLLYWGIKDPPEVHGDTIKATLEVRKNLDKSATDSIRRKIRSTVKKENKDRVERLLAAERKKREQLKDECLTELADDKDFREQDNNTNKALVDLMKAKTGLTDVEAYIAARNKVEALLTVEAEKRLDDYIRPRNIPFTFKKNDIEKVLYSDEKDLNPFWCVGLARFLKIKTQEEENKLKQLMSDYSQNLRNHMEYDDPEEYFEKKLAKETRHLVYLKTISYFLFHLSLL